MGESPGSMGFLPVVTAAVQKATFRTWMIFCHLRAIYIVQFFERVRFDVLVDLSRMTELQNDGRLHLFHDSFILSIETGKRVPKNSQNSA